MSIGIGMRGGINTKNAATTLWSSAMFPMSRTASEKGLARWLMIYLIPVMAMAQEAAGSNEYDMKSMTALAAGMAIALAAFGGALGQARAAAAAPGSGGHS